MVLWACYTKFMYKVTWHDSRDNSQHNATDEYACTECGHHGNGQVPGCTCIGCDDACGKSLVEWPYGNCTERAGHAGDCDRRQATPRRSAPEAQHNGTDERVRMINSHNIGTKVWDNGVMAGVLWDGFTGTETLKTDRIEPIPATKVILTEREREAGLHSIGSSVYLAPQD